jgi:hypothetical protein
VLANAGRPPVDGAATLYVDGEEQDSGPGWRMKNYHAGPTLGCARRHATHQAPTEEKRPSDVDWWNGGLKGRISRFRLLNSADPP